MQLDVVQVLDFNSLDIMIFLFLFLFKQYLHTYIVLRMIYHHALLCTCTFIAS